MPDTWKKATIILTATAALAVAGGAGAVAGDLIGTKDLKDNAVTSAKLGEGSVHWGKHLNENAKDKIKSFAGSDGVDGVDGVDGPARCRRRRRRYRPGGPGGGQGSHRPRWCGRAGR